ncbi:hypothetical protein [Geobacillus thermocatenulatus]|uniref:hypothetical protein n=1 Tax=Geobacillus thermocatenulatus TaxID=33938 RepID=UPI0004741741|nr:hypothetical protein [Geobacillus thermocatenulatus]
MKEALIYAGAFVVALFLVWLLPLGLSRIGGMAAVAMALAAALLTEISEPLLPLWQTGLAVLLLLAAASYLLDRRFGAALYRRTDSQSTGFMDDAKEGFTGREPSSAAIVPPQHPPLVEAVPSLPLSESFETLEEGREAAEQSTEADHHGRADLLVEEAEEMLRWEQAEEAAGVSEPLRRDSDWLDQWPGAVTPDLEAVVHRDEAGGEGETEPLLDAAQPEHAPTLSVAVDDMDDEWRRWMNEDEYFRVQAEQDGLLSMKGLDEERDESWSETAVSEERALAEMSELGHNQDEQQMESGSRSALADELAAWSDEEGDALGSDGESADVERSEWLRDDAAEQPVSMQEETAPLGWAIAAGERGHAPASAKVQMAAAELVLNRDRFTAEAYEQCLRQCLQAPLSDRDYYVFSRLLLEHYARERKVQQLIAWIDELEPRFSSYPAIIAELALWRDAAATLANDRGEER